MQCFGGEFPCFEGCSVTAPYKYTDVDRMLALGTELARVYTCIYKVQISLGLSNLFIHVSLFT